MIKKRVKVSHSITYIVHWAVFLTLPLTDMKAIFMRVKIVQLGSRLQYLFARRIG